MRYRFRFAAYRIELNTDLPLDMDARGARTFKATGGADPDMRIYLMSKRIPDKARAQRSRFSSDDDTGMWQAYEFIDDVPVWGVSFNKEMDEVVALAYCRGIYSTQTLFLRIVLLRYAMEGYCGLHGVTMSVGTHVFLLIAASGVGKSTHAEHWRRLYGAEILNGDFALLDVDAQFHGTPFCGSSGICQDKTVRVTDIVLIERSSDNEAVVLSAKDALLAVLANTYVPHFHEQSCARVIENIGLMLKNVRVWKLRCTVDAASAQVLYHAVMTRKDSFPEIRMVTRKKDDAYAESHSDSGPGRANIERRIEMEELKAFGQVPGNELSEDDLEKVSGGAGETKQIKCNWCGAMISYTSFRQLAAHQAVCPKNPNK